jgi:hypothetical protein
VDRYLDNRHQEILWNLLANPADTGPLYKTNLQRLVNDYPQSGLLQVLLARTNDNGDMSKAAAYFNPKALYKLVHNPGNLAEVDPDKITNAFVREQAIPEDFLSASFTSAYKGTVQPPEITAIENTFSQEQAFDDSTHNIDDEVFDEIVAIEEIGVSNAREGKVVPEPLWPETEEKEYTEDELPDGPTNEVAATGSTVYADEEKLILGNIVSADYLSFDKRLDSFRSGQQKATETQNQTAKPVSEPVVEKQEVSRYNDDKLPYSFLWWLDKTRKEHASTLQPYTTASNGQQQQADTIAATEPVSANTVQKSVADELQHQYYENIFSLTTVNSIPTEDVTAKLEFDHNKKEDVIIERFITTEPQIKPPAANKLDNENKAKKSSEDQDILVTETLARIYTDQMLYHKAIATYKKLILKFPEKKLYFATQIEQLEKRTN